MNDCRRPFGKKNTKLFLTREKHWKKYLENFGNFLKIYFLMMAITRI